MPSRERIKELLPVLHAYADGKTIEVQDTSGSSFLMSPQAHIGLLDDHIYRVAFPESERVDGAHAACDVSDGNAEWKEDGTAKGRLVAGTRAWFWTNGEVWTPPPGGSNPKSGALVTQDISDGQRVEFCWARREIRPSTETPVSDGNTDGNGTIKYGSGAVRSSDAEDQRYDLIHPIAIEAWAETAAEGARKYGDGNWEKGMPARDLLNHALRHIYQYLGGDRSEPHLPHALWNLGGAIVSLRRWPHLNRGKFRDAAGVAPGSPGYVDPIQC